MAYIHKMCGVCHTKYNILARQMWQWAEQRNIFLFALYITSKDNSVADVLFRINNIDTEWGLCSEASVRIIEESG